MNHFRAKALILMLLPLQISGVWGDPIGQPRKGGQTMRLTSTAIMPGETIPRQYTCDGRDLSPPLQWTDPPTGTQSLALIADDPDAPSGTFVHWVIFNLPATTRALPEGLLAGVPLTGNTRHGRNSWGNKGYGGPCPPSGVHRYFFKLYALDTQFDLPAGATKEQVLRAAQGHVLAQAELMGRYSRR